MTSTTDHICGPFELFYLGKLQCGTISTEKYLLEWFNLFPNDTARCQSCHKLYVVKDGRLTEIKGGIVIPGYAPDDGHSVRGIPVDLMQQPESEVKSCDKNLDQSNAPAKQQEPDRITTTLLPVPSVASNDAPDVQAGRTRPPYSQPPSSPPSQTR